MKAQPRCHAEGHACQLVTMAPAGTWRQCHSATVAFKVLPDAGPLCHSNDSKSREGVSVRHTLGHILAAGGAEYVPRSASVVVVGFFHHLGTRVADTIWNELARTPGVLDLSWGGVSLERSHGLPVINRPGSRR